MKSFASNGDYVLLVRDAHVYCDVDIGEQAAVVVVDTTQYLADIARSVGCDRIRHLRNLAVPTLSGKRIPADVHRLSCSQLPDFGLIDKSPHLHSPQIRELEQQFALLHVLALLDRNRVDGAIEWRSNFRVL